MDDPRMPVLIGAGQRTWRKEAPPAPRAMVLEAVEAAAADAGIAMGALAATDTIGVVGFTVDAPSRQPMPVPRLKNPPAALAADLGASPRTEVYSHMGGNTPQALVNWACERIAQGEADLVVLAGAEFLGDLLKRAETGQDLSKFANTGPDSAPERFGDGRPGCTPQEEAHGLHLPANTYPLFENALRAKLGRSLADHQRAMGDLFARFNAVAARNPLAWFPTPRTAGEIAADSADNRMVGFPYTKYMNAVIRVDQSAAVIVASTRKADELGVPANRRVYLHGCSDANEKWHVLDRVDYATAPAIGMSARKAFDMAGKTPAEMSFFDIYSCFPSAVQIAAAEIGIDADDPRGLTVTGGLPYFGGPGNNYVMHSIAEMMGRLRGRPGAFGLVTANGWFLTKHAMGIYSTTPPAKPWARENPKSYQAEIDAMKSPAIVAEPSGRATIETYTVVHARDSYRMGIVIGRDANGRRFVANTPADEATLRDLESREGVGRTGVVTSSGDGMKNLFTPD